MKINKVLFWTIQILWNPIENLLGVFLFLLMIMLGKKPIRYHQAIRFEIGKNYGGFNFAWCIVTNEKPSQHLLKHEHGHFIQGMFFGTFEILIQLMSIIRYWYRIIVVKLKLKKSSDLPPYESIWFEKQATDLGYKYLED